MDDGTADLPHHPIHAAPVKLVLLPPDENSRQQSWIGGAPALAPGMDWPETNGTPDLFLAQIALSEVPEQVWGGLGPRDGWLLFFLSDEGDAGSGVTILYTNGPTEERIWPDARAGTNRSYDGGEAVTILEIAGLDVTMARPRFDVTFEPLEGQSRAPLPDAARGATDLRVELEKEVTVASPKVQPFDNATARSLVAALILNQKITLDGSAYARPSAAERAVRSQAIAKLDACMTELSAQQESGHFFGPEDAAAIMATLAEITVQSDETEASGATRLGPPTSILAEYHGVSYARTHEILLLEALRDRPAQVPDALREHYIAQWRADQQVDFAVIGGRARNGSGTSKAQSAVLLLELPSSPRAGWVFGDGARLGLFLAPEDLEQGRFHMAWGALLP